MTNKPQINKLILNFFIREGYKDAALTFAKENNIDLYQDSLDFLSPDSKTLLENLTNVTNDKDFIHILENHKCTSKSEINVSDSSNGFDTINERKQIKYLILQGSIPQAIEKISEYFPSVLDCNNLLHFKLLRLSLIEMIRNHRVNQANDTEKQFLSDILSFVRNNLINKVTKSFKLLKELEITMSLLCFDFNSFDVTNELPEELSELFDISLRNQCYKLVNREILNFNKSNDLKSICEDQGKFEKLKKPDKQINYNPQLTNLNNLKLLLDESIDTEELEVKKEPSPLQDEIAEDQIDKLQELEYDSKLEKVIKLWALTEKRMVELNVIEDSRLSLNDEFL